MIDTTIDIDFNVVPDPLKTGSIDNLRPRSLRQMADLLQISYKLTDHPILKAWKHHDAIDFFVLKDHNKEMFKICNRIVIERTIEQSYYLSQYKSDDGTLTIQGKGIELSIILVESFLLTANKLYNSTEEELEELGAGVHYFRLTRSGELQACIMEFLDTCYNLIELTYQHSIREHLNKITTDDDKVKYLLRQKSNLLQQKDQFTEKVFNSIIGTIDIELNYHKSINDFLGIPAEIREIITQFLAEKNARISNNRLLGYLLEEKIDDFCNGLSELVLQLFSYHDVGGQEAEKVYHGFLLGVFNSFNSVYALQSNKEAGKGRFDIMLIPATQEYRGIIFEVKRASDDKDTTLTRLHNEALNQIVENNYAIELKSKGHQQYVAISAVFHGKVLSLKYQIHSSG